MNGDAQHAMTLMRNSAAAVESHPWVRMNLAWGLAVCPDDELRNGAEAVRTCRPLVAERPLVANDIFSLETLAAAFAEAGLVPQAVETQQHALDVATGLQRRFAGDRRVFHPCVLAVYREKRPLRLLRP
jgi:hypothetical protein